MKKIINSLLILAISLLFVSCTKTPFKEETPLTNSALVYVYVVEGEIDNDAFKIPYYEVKINEKFVEGKIYPHEFLKYNLDADSVTIEVVRNDIEKKGVKLDLKRGESHFLRVKNNGSGFAKFDFEVVPRSQALSEIKETKYAKYEDAGVLDILITKDDVKKGEAKASHPSGEVKSKTQKIKEAHALKEDGIITDQEFQKLKAEILDAD
jgi:hypothetical protein